MVTTASAILMTGLGYVTSNDIARSILLMMLGMLFIEGCVVFFLQGKRVK